MKIKPGRIFTEADQAASKATRRARAAARAADLAPILAELQAQGVTSCGGLARALTEAGIPTARGASAWSSMQVSRLLENLCLSGIPTARGGMQSEVQVQRDMPTLA